jgi:hypothetical protein
MEGVSAYGVEPPNVFADVSHRNGLPQTVMALRAGAMGGLAMLLGSQPPGVVTERVGEPGDGIGEPIHEECVARMCQKVEEAYEAEPAVQALRKRFTDMGHAAPDMLATPVHLATDATEVHMSSGQPVTACLLSSARLPEYVRASPHQWAVVGYLPVLGSAIAGSGKSPADDVRDEERQAEADLFARCRGLGDGAARSCPPHGQAAAACVGGRDACGQRRWGGGLHGTRAGGGACRHVQCVGHVRHRDGQRRTHRNMTMCVSGATRMADTR